MPTKADIYGNVGWVTEEPELEQASGGVVVASNGPTISWLGILILLVAWRIIIELAEEV